MTILETETCLPESGMTWYNAPGWKSP